MLNTTLKRLAELATWRRMGTSVEVSNELLAALGNPQHHYPTIHVGGTNGKGSVTCKIASALQHSGLRAGLYISPHLSTFRERVQINRQPIALLDVEGYLQEIFAIIDRLSIQATFFEVLTAVAFLHFSKTQVDVAVIEVGLGGRLDATNVIFPQVSVITSIDLDHCAILGSTRQAIASEKGGIIKQGVPLILGPHAQNLGLEEMAEEREAPVIRVRQEDWVDYREENQAIARAALEILPFSLAGLSLGLQSELPCRFEVVDANVPVILDVAHNANGLKRLLQVMALYYPGAWVEMIVGFSAGKDLHGSLEILRPLNRIHVVSSSHPRLIPYQTLVPQVRERGLEVASSGLVSEVLPSVLKTASKGIIVICGSCFLMEAVGAMLERPWAMSDLAAIEKDLVPSVG